LKLKINKILKKYIFKKKSNFQIVRVFCATKILFLFSTLFFKKSYLSLSNGKEPHNLMVLPIYGRSLKALTEQLVLRSRNL
jgi:hypothetical protein